MLNILFNHEVIAIPPRESNHPGSSPVEPFEMFGTEYGMFIPITLSGYQFLRWVRRGKKDKLPKNSISCYFLHISNDGEVMITYVDTEENNISMVPYVSERFTLMNISRDVGEAFSHLLRGCKTIAEAIKYVEDNNVDGLYSPFIIFPSEWVKHAKECGYDKIFLDTSFDNTTA
jgi:hypothetical protein